MLEGDARLHRLGGRGRPARLRLVLDDRAPLPARGLRGDPERPAALDVGRGAHVERPARHDVQRRAAVEPAAPRRGLRHAAQPVGRAGDPRRRPRHGAARGAAPQRQGRLDRVPRQPRSAGRRRAQPRGVRGVDGDRPACPRPRLVLVPGQALPHPRPRDPRSRLHGAGAHADPAPAVPVRDLAGRHQPADARLRARRRPRRGVLEPALRVHQALLGHVRRALRRSARRRVGAAREAHARRRGTHRGQLREGARDGAPRPRRVLEVPRAVRVEQGLHGCRRQAGQAGPDPDARRVAREQDDPARYAGTGRRGDPVLPRPARPRAPDDLPPPARRHLQEGRRANGKVHHRGRSRF